MKKIIFPFLLFLFFTLSCAAPKSGGMPVLSGLRPISALLQEAKEEAHNRINADLENACAILDAHPMKASKKTFPFRAAPLKRQTLSPAQQVFYDEMKHHIQNFQSFSYAADEIGYDGLDDVLFAFQTLIEDSPFLGMYARLEEIPDAANEITIGLSSLYFLPGDAQAKEEANLADILFEMQIFREECQLAVNALPKNRSAYDQYRYFGILISLRTAYDFDGTGGIQTGNAYGAIAGGHAICQGYAQGFSLLCQMANLDCKIAEGIVSGNVSHAWNLVQLEEGSYHVDITWCDASPKPGMGDWHRYFMLTQAEIELDHETNCIASGKTEFLYPDA